jgi:tetratricopeptide (TPR) repeat protein
MRTLTTLFLCLLIVPFLHAQIDLTPSQWQEDLRFLQKTVHEDYDFLFKKVTTEEFDAEVEKLFKAIPEMDDHEVIVGLARIVALFKYGHTGIGMTGWRSHNNHLGFHQMPYNLYHFNDGVFVQGVHKDYERALGAKVLKIESTPIEEALAAIRPAVSDENDQYFKAHGLHYLGTSEVLHAQGVTNELKTEITLTLEKEGETFEVTFAPVETQNFPGRYGLIETSGDWLDARDQGPLPLWRKNLERIYFYQYLPEQKTVYVRQSQIQDDSTEAIPAFYERVFEFIENNEVERLVLDLRLNGGGNNYKNKPVVTGIIETKKINRPGKLFVIIGRRTFSACQNLVNELDNYTNAIFVGEPTAENINFYGDVRRVELPHSKIPVRLSFAWWQDKPQWENGPWTPPHVAVDMSFDDYKANRDPVLKSVWNYDDESPIIKPMEHLTALFVAGKLDEVKSEAARLVNDPRYRYYNFEEQFNRAGYNLLGDNQLQSALFVFELNAELFPESANVWDSLAEAYWKAGNKEKAIQYYQKAISLDPEGSVGDNARNMLKRIKAEE